jgi:DNA polymerase-3 subunit delta'
MDEKTASLLALSSEGSIKKALEEGKKEHFDLRYDLIKKVSSMDTRTDLSEWLFLADDLGKDKNSISEKLYILAGWYRDVMLYRETGNTDRLIYKDFCEKIKRLSENISGSDILECIKIIDKAHDSIAKNVNIRLVLEFMMLKLACACSSELNLGR